MIYKKLKIRPEESRNLEDTLASTAKQQALIEYIAIMTDVELPSEESEESSNE